MGEIRGGASASGTRVERLSALVRHTMARARAAAVPYRLGEIVIGDDPFNGRREGAVAVKKGTFVGLQIGDQMCFYDYRQLRRSD
ncbi:hypothetical protein [Arthrobacter sp. ISL-95]|uniref:hypothetical protein n=1 Tax=Arthrobacter sp. ISL-95 TaxID=2819116 RepID=UPI001BEBEC9D|nr:hypothetical protein [Arthrobacter sp. ISL-95]MBT2588374.1 hypothetical protein [Arthrobacter sp. ISL-95]